MKKQTVVENFNHSAKRKTEIIFAVFTPFSPDGSINWARIEDLFQHCVQSGASGVFLNGTTGEFASLSLTERLQLMDAWTASRNHNNLPDFKIIVHVGSANLQEAAEMAEHAEALDVDGVAMVAPYYFRPQTLEGLIEQCQYVAAAASQTPFYYYNIPYFTGVNFPLINFFEMAVERIPNFAGLKNSSPNLVDHQHCIHYAKENYALYWGMDEVFMMLYSGGNNRFVGSTYNYMNSFYTNMVDAYHQGDEETVLNLQAEADAIHRVILSTNNGIAAGKEIMRFLGIECGAVRLPLKKITEEESKILYQKLQSTTLFKQVIEK
jgi:N-acetylneuraminate lyase